jgi:hypothetical protein
MATVVHLYRFWQDLPDSLLYRPPAIQRVEAVQDQSATDDLAMPAPSEPPRPAATLSR